MNRRVRVVLLVFGIVAAAFAALARDAAPPLEANEISAVDLALRIRDRQSRLLVIDARAPDAFDQDHLPGARLLDDTDAHALAAADTVVVYAETDAGASALRKHPGVRRVLQLHGGIAAWNEQVLFPALRADANAAQRREFAVRARLSRYFGGAPRILDPGASALRGRSRRGC